MIKKTLFELHKLHKVISAYKREKIIKNNKNYSNSNKTRLKIFPNVRK